MQIFRNCYKVQTHSWGIHQVRIEEKSLFLKSENGLVMGRIYILYSCKKIRSNRTELVVFYRNGLIKKSNDKNVVKGKGSKEGLTSRRRIKNFSCLPQERKFNWRMALIMALEYSCGSRLNRRNQPEVDEYLIWRQIFVISTSLLVSRVLNIGYPTIAHMTKKVLDRHLITTSRPLERQRLHRASGNLSMNADSKSIQRSSHLPPAFFYNAMAMIRFYPVKPKKEKNLKFR